MHAHCPLGGQGNPHSAITGCGILQLKLTLLTLTFAAISASAFSAAAWSVSLSCCRCCQAAARFTLASMSFCSCWFSATTGASSPADLPGPLDCSRGRDPDLWSPRPAALHGSLLVAGMLPDMR